MNDLKKLLQTVFPSEQQTIEVYDPDDAYGGAHKYLIRNCLGFADGKTEYENGATRDHYQIIQFVQKKDDGTVVAGVQSEQLAIIMLDRVKKLDARFPSEHNQKQIQALEMYLEACADRVRDRMNRNVMGDLKK